jgi:hypothetical protein
MKRNSHVGGDRCQIKASGGSVVFDWIAVETCVSSGTPNETFNQRDSVTVLNETM